MANFDHTRLKRVSDVCRRYVDEGKMAHTDVQIADRNGVVFRDVYGHADIASGTALTTESIFRIYSMTKPITSLIIMQMYEEGTLLLEDPISRFLPELANPKVFIGGSDISPKLRAAEREPTIQDLLRHTAGYTYGWARLGPVERLYRNDDLGSLSSPSYDLEGFIATLAEKPLCFDPGTAWRYSVATDVLGAAIQRIEGDTLGAVMRRRVFDPLDMVDTGFFVPPEKTERFTSLYSTINGLSVSDRREGSYFCSQPSFESGGGGLVSTTRDYQQFATMLLNHGALGGNRLIGRKTLEYMAINHLPNGLSVPELSTGGFSEAYRFGTGYGLGFSIVTDTAAHAALVSHGEYGWGGAASTVFWIDPVEAITVIFMTQLMPSSAYPIRRELRATINQALL